MLTPRQIGDVRDDLRLITERGFASGKNLLTALDAYARVVGLLERWESDPGRGSCAWEDSMRPIVNDLRRAVEGDDG